MTKTYKDIVDRLANELNDFSFSSLRFCDMMGRQHRTLQQTFTKLCFVWIKHCAKDDYPHDDRNRASHVKCKAIVDKMSKDSAWDQLPFI